MRISDWSSDVCSSDLRAVDKRGDTIDFYLSPTRSAKAAKRFLGKALRGLKHWEKLATLNTDKAPSYGAAITELKREGKLDRETAHWQVKYLNNVIEADHGKIGRDHVLTPVTHANILCRLLLAKNKPKSHQ